MMTLKPTIINGKWVCLPAPPQDREWLKRHSTPQLSNQKEAVNG